MIPSRQMHKPPGTRCRARSRPAAGRRPLGENGAQNVEAQGPRATPSVPRGKGEEHQQTTRSRLTRCLCVLTCCWYPASLFSLKSLAILTHRARPNSTRSSRLFAAICRFERTCAASPSKLDSGCARRFVPTTVSDQLRRQSQIAAALFSSQRIGGTVWKPRIETALLQGPPFTRIILPP